MNKQILFLADEFASDSTGGAELTTEAVINDSPSDIDVIMVRTSELNIDIINKFKDNKWIIGNFFGLNPDHMIHLMSKKIDYSIIEYDYKYCVMRIPKLHKKLHGGCCEESVRGQLISLFMSLSQSLWYMSSGQKNWYEKQFPALKKANSYVLGSLLEKKTIDYINTLDCSNKNDTYMIQDHPHILKGTKAGIELAEIKNLKYELFGSMKSEPHHEVLQKFAKAKGLIFVPTEFDTCPRITIEAKLLGCDLLLGENVQHKDEEWFSGNNTEMINHMKNRTKFFWETI